MLMSIFSSFDAVTAESLGHKFGFPNQDAAVKADDSKRRQEVKSSPAPPSKTVESCRGKRSPRFAPEIDGVHCFETILPY